MSTQSARSLGDAALALDVVRDLSPLRSVLAGAGIQLSPGQMGHVWAFSPSSLIARGSEPLAAGDLALRLEPGLRVRRVYEVMAFLPGRAELPARVNGREWGEGREPYPNVTVFRPFLQFPETNFHDLVDPLLHDEYVTGPRYEARFIPVEADLLAANVATRIGSLVAPASVPVPGDRQVRSRRETWARSGATLFRSMVFSAQRKADGRVSCAACDIEDERVLEAAHIVDYGLIEDEWWNGLPLCRNHHRLFDLHALRLGDDGTWHADDGLEALGVTRRELSVTSPVAADVVKWRAAVAHR